MCECGGGPVVRARGHNARLYAGLYGCHECNAIDGTSPRQRDAIQAMRITGGEMTTMEIATEIGAPLNSIFVALRRMEERGMLTSRLGEYVGEVTRFGKPYGRSDLADREVNSSSTVRYWRIAGRPS
jgi:hypothetical protein